MKRIKLYPPPNNAFILPDLLVSSSTLFGALANAHVLLYGSDSFPDFYRYFENGLRISSLFPALQIGETEVFFFPKPYLLYKAEGTISDDIGLNKKALKKLHYFSRGLLEKLKQFIKMEDGFYYNTLDFKNDDIILIGGKFAALKSELVGLEKEIDPEELTLFSEAEFPHVGVPRFGGESEPFSQVEISLPQLTVAGNNVSLFYYYLEENTPEEKKWPGVKQLFAEEGIGGKRSLGKGWFAGISEEEFSWKEPGQAQLYLLLSDMIPKKEELDHILTYEFMRDDGFVTFGGATPHRKGSLMLIKSGAIADKPLQGRIIKEKIPSGFIFRYGKALLFPLIGEKNGYTI